MKLRSAVPWLFTLVLAAGLFAAQGLNDNTQTKEQWEEINFEFNSSVLSDGYPSLLRLADLLKEHPDYKVRIDGNTDSVGSNKYNEKLAMRRAETVKEFLVKYGAAPGQIETTGHGKVRPEVSNGSKEGRFMNRRVVLTVMDGQGRIVSAAGVGPAIAAIQKETQAEAKCCDDILKKLDKLDDILAMLKDLKAENDRLRADVDALKRQQQPPPQVAEMPKPPSKEDIEGIVGKAADKAIDKAKASRFTLLGVNAGPDAQGRLTFTGKGRFFSPLGKDGTHAFQAEGEYMRWYDRQEGQFDFGLVNRFSDVQLGLFSSFKHVTVRDMQSGGTLGQASVTFDWLFGRGRVGVFGSKGFLDDAVLGRTPLGPDVFLESYLKIVDQVGVSTSFGLFGNTYLEANIGYLKSPGHVDRPGGTGRFVFPLNNRFAFTVEGGMNETLLAADNSGRIAFGVQLGNWMKPKEYKLSGKAVPADIPRVRYELLTRRVRTGIGTPVADAGPDQIGIPAGTVTLNGSGSYDPDGETLTYQWSQITGPTVAIANPTGAIATFTAAAGENYAFRLMVKNPEGGQASARTTVTTALAPGPRIITFTASPTAIQPGNTTLIVWQVDNADQVTLNGTQVDPKAGTSTFAPQTTTQYTLVARNSVGQVSQTLAVQVTPVAPPPVTTPPSVLLFQAIPTNINQGETSTLTWAVLHADSVTITPDVGPVALTGTRPVSPKSTTTYTLTAKNSGGTSTATAVVTVQTTPTGTVPSIVQFTVNPPQITAGQSAMLMWQVQNADTITIDNNVGSVSASGTKSVTPAATTTYTITATNKFGTATAAATCTVTPVITPPPPPPPTGKASVIEFIATPTYSPYAGADVILQWQTTNAKTVTITGLTGTLPVTGATTLTPQVTTTYTLTATGAGGDTVTASVTVTVPGPTPPSGKGQPPIANAGPNVTVTVNEIYLDGSHSYDPAGGQLKFNWTAVTPGAFVVNPTLVSPTAFLGTTLGDYVFNLTVTNSAGLSATSSVTITYGAGVAPSQ